MVFRLVPYKPHYNDVTARLKSLSQRNLDLRHRGSAAAIVEPQQEAAQFSAQLWKLYPAKDPR